MRRGAGHGALLAVIAVTATVALAGDGPQWHRTLEKGVTAAKRSGKPILVITTWKKGVCASCDTWEDRVPVDPDVIANSERFESVKWFYDGLGGKVIRWTMENGNENEDPSVLAFVASSDGTVRQRAPDPYTPTSFARWLAERADAVEREFPRSRVPFLRAAISVEGEGEDRAVFFDELDAAREAKTPVLLFIGRSSRIADGKRERVQAKSTRRLEKTTFDSKAVVGAAEGWTLLRLDVADGAHADIAKELGLTEVPGLVAFPPGAEEPLDLGAKITAGTLAGRLKKLREP